MRVMKIATLCLLPALAAAGDLLQQQLQQCRNMSDVTRRLACYDALPLPAPQAPTAALAQGTAAPARSGHANAAATAATQAQEQRFGFATPAPAPAAIPLQAVESVIEGRFLGWSAGSQLRLRNGQIWQVIDDSAGAYDLMNPHVIVERGRFGGHFMRIDKVGPTPRVRRLQ